MTSKLLDLLYYPANLLNYLINKGGVIHKRNGNKFEGNKFEGICLELDGKPGGIIMHLDLDKLDKLDKLSIKEIQQYFIDNKVEEDIHLDYKGCDALREYVKSEIGKDVSSFANSDGGLIIYGIIEKKESIKIDEGYKKDEKKEKWLEDIILSHIDPKIDGIRIKPINISDSNPDSNQIIVVYIPKSNRTPHQAKDKRYYKRVNLQSAPMEEYEVKDLYYKAILSQTELRKLYYEVRQELYKPLYKSIKLLDEYFEQDPYPRKIYNKICDGDGFQYDFKIWNKFKLEGKHFDMKAIGDNKIITLIDEFDNEIDKYNNIIEKGKSNELKKLALSLKDKIKNIIQEIEERIESTYPL